MTNEQKLREALQDIKGIVCGERSPYWVEDGMTVTGTRGWIADICDLALIPSLQPPTSDEGAPLREAISAAKNMDWQQVVLNGGPPCFHLEEGRFCGRAARWAGHDEAHKFVSLADLMLAATPTPSDSKPGEGNG